MEYLLVHNEDAESYLTIGTDNGFGVFWADQGNESLNEYSRNSTRSIDISKDKNR